jgi:Iap family predicted aminopeptidase
MNGSTIFKFLLISLIASVPVLVSAQGIKLASKEDIAAAVNAVPCKIEERLEGVRKQFLAAGAKEEDIKIEKFDKDKISNVVVLKKGTTDETVIIGAHYDRVDSGCGVVDNWTGVVIMTQIYKVLASMTTNKSYVFVAFDKEEEGLRGSNQMTKAMTPEQIAKTCSMLNFDSFGQAAPMSLRSVSSSKLLDLAKEIGKEGGLKFIDVEIPGASADSASFRNRKIAAITLSGLAGNWQSILHTSNDKIAKVNIESVYLGYRFGLVFTSKVDAAGCKDYN